MAKFKLAEAFVSFFADLTGLRAGLKDAKGETQKTVSTIGASLKTIARFAFPAGITVGIIAAGKAAIDSADRIYQLSLRTGETAENLSRLDYAAMLSDLSLEGLTNGLKFLSRNTKEAVQGNKEAQASFRDVGVSMDDLKKKSPTQILMQIADAFESGTQKGSKMTAALGVFGKGALEMIPLLNEGSARIKAMMDEADRLGVTVSAEFAKDAADFNDNLDRMAWSARGLARSIASPLVTQLNVLVKYLNGDFAVSTEKTTRSLTPWQFILTALNLAIINVTSAGKAMATVFGAQVTMAFALMRKSISGASPKELWVEWKNTVQKTAGELLKIHAEWDNAIQGVADSLERVPEAGQSASDSALDYSNSADQAAEAVAKLNASLTVNNLQLAMQQAKLRGDTVEVERLSRAIDQLAAKDLLAGGADPAKVQEMMRRSAAIRAAERAKEADATAAKGLEELGKFQDEQQAIVAKYNAENRALEKQNLDWMMELRASGAAQAIELSKTSLQKLTEEYAANARTMEQVYSSAIYSTEALFSDVLYAGITGNLDDIDDAFKSFLKDLVRQISNFLAQQAVLKLLASFGGAAAGSGSGGGFVSGSISGSSASWKMANGGVLPGGFRAFANGGVVTDPTLGLVGEGRYNEAVIPLPDGKSVPVVQTGGRDPIELTNNVNVVLGTDFVRSIRPMVQPTDGEITIAVERALLTNGQIRKTIRNVVR